MGTGSGVGAAGDGLAAGLSRSERKEQTRQAILEAALRLANAETLAAVSLRQVTREVGLVPTAFYRHFGSIAELGLELVEDSFVSLRRMIREVRAGTPDLEDVVRRSVVILVTHVEEHRAHFGFIARERFGGVPEVRAAIRRQLDLFEAELADDVRMLPTMDTWSEEDLRTLASLIVNAMVGVVEAVLDTEPGGDPADHPVVRTARTQLHLVIVGAANWRRR